MERIKDLRQYIDILAKLGDIRTIDREVDPHLEMAAIARRGYDLHAPAPLFNHIRGTSRGMRAMGGPAALSSVPGKPAARVALSVGLSADASWLDIVECLAASKHATPIPPRLVANAPCKQHILHGKEASLDLFPIPYLHDGDGGPYCNTWGTIVVKTPDGKWTNWSIARIQKLDAHRMTGLFMHPQHINTVWEAWRKIGKPMPFAVVQGAEPALPIVSSMPLDEYVNESDYLGGHFGEAIEVVSCETVDLDVPASAEIVIEGHVSIEREAEEGPFGEYPGYVVTEKSLQPVYHVECITYRDGAIWPFIPEGRPIDEYHTTVAVALSAEALSLLQEAGLPVAHVWSPLETANHWLFVTVQADWRDKLPGVSSEAFTDNIAQIIWNTKFGLLCPVIYVLDDDIDPTQPKDYLWAVATRCHPTKRCITSIGPVLPIIACYTDEERHARTGERVAHDCLLPAPGQGRQKHSSFEGAYPQEIRERVIHLWDAE
ncbi:UbiD family decarboxylase [Samsonia erythrinae]|uniref:Pyrrole-2-carboxylic acid decarboxylase n=1 Tax=Samsonia erythrinae TaxID=160434 RepID=A0A4R3VSP4_9GAMM|nr:UbiD family decarboxylase [Samsonia erythrinae]TCV06972.1 4-hydroxy-3-polyprenylbenzoate decarboxylase [Samsonia erythrinae]